MKRKKKITTVEALRRDIFQCAQHMRAEWRITDSNDRNEALGRVISYAASLAALAVTRRDWARVAEELEAVGALRGAIDAARALAKGDPSRALSALWAHWCVTGSFVRRVYRTPPPNYMTPQGAVRARVERVRGGAT